MMVEVAVKMGWVTRQTEIPGRLVDEVVVVEVVV